MTKSKKTGPAYFKMFRHIVRSSEWLGISCTARAAYVQVASRYNGRNNGTIALAVRTLARELRCSRATASRALVELDDAGLVRPTYIAQFSRDKNRRATEFLITAFPENLDPNGGNRTASTVSSQDPNSLTTGHYRPSDETVQSHHRSLAGKIAKNNRPSGETHLRSKNLQRDLPARCKRQRAVDGGAA